MPDRMSDQFGRYDSSPVCAEDGKAVSSTEECAAGLAGCDFKRFCQEHLALCAGGCGKAFCPADAPRFLDGNLCESCATAEDPGWTEGFTALVMQGNEFAALGFLQHAQTHLMRTERGISDTLTVSLDGDFAAILKLQSAEGDVLAWATSRAVDRAIDRLEPKAAA